MHRPARPGVITGIHSLTSDRFHRPVVDDGGLLWFGDRWVAVTDMQAPIVHLLLANLGHEVPREAIVETYAAAGGSTKDEAILSVMRRVAGHFTRLGARVRIAYQGGAMAVWFPTASPMPAPA